MTIAITIGGAAIKREQGSLNIRKSLGERSTAQFTVVDELGTASYSKGQPVIVTHGGGAFRDFGGPIDSVERFLLPGSSILYHTIVCTGWEYLADKRRAFGSYVLTPAGTIVAALVTDYLAAEGVTVGDIDPGATIADLKMNYVPVSEALQKLADLSDYIWWIDEFKALYFVPRLASAAPFGVAAIDMQRDSVNSRQTATQYRNRQYLRGGCDVTSLQTENKVGDGVATAFTVGYPINTTPGVTVGGVLQTIGVKGIATGKQCYWAKGDPVITFTVAPGNGVAVVIQYYGLFDIFVQVDDLLAQATRQAVEGGTGIVEAMDDDASLTTQQAALDKAQSLLAKYAVIGERFQFDIFDYGLAPGQLVPVTYPKYGFTATNMLVESVETSEFGPDTPLYTVAAVASPEIGDWTRLFKKLASQKDEVLERLTLGKDQVIILLVQRVVNWEWGDMVTEDVFTCPLCAPATICGPTTIVC